MDIVTTLKRKISMDGAPPIVLPVVHVQGAVLASFLSYQVSRYGKSKSWHAENSRAVALLLKYCLRVEPNSNSPKSLFENFVRAIEYGTVSVDGEDKTVLRWYPKSPNVVKRKIQYITAFSDWLYLETGGESALLNKFKVASKQERMLNLAAYHHKKNNSFLKHTYSDERAAQEVNRIRELYRKDPLKSNNATFNFPKEKTWELLDKGFVIYGSRPSDPIYKRHDLAKVLAVMLMRFAGLRISECLHIYNTDILFDSVSTKAGDPAVSG